MRFHWWQQSFLVLGGLLSIMFVLLIVYFLSRQPSVEDFFKAYWQRPIPLQGSPPASFSDREASLRPEACGQCHAQEYADWKESLHSKAMGPGPWGQIIDLTADSPGEAILCMSCHAPLSEQIPLRIKTVNGDKQEYEKNPHFDSQLQLQGITCAACHVRQHQRFGPPIAEGAAATKYPAEMPGHGGVKRTPYFERAEFCKDCHQFAPENTALVNEKPLQDTYREWQNSSWGKGGASCQQCHMPSRRHLWKGIHDAEWVRGGVRIETGLRKRSPGPGNRAELTVDVINSAVGHKFPTYVTPKVFVRAALLDGAGKDLHRTEQEGVIGWDARFENGKWKEYFDTRIPPGEKFQATFRWTLPNEAKKIRAWVEVHPDHFYHLYFYPTHLKEPDLSPESRKLIEKALQDSGRTPYVLFEQIFSLD